VVQGVQAGLVLTKTSGMGWQLDIGRCIIAPATAANGAVVATVTVAETGSFAAGDATRDRIDVVALQIDETATTGNGLPAVKSVVIQGAYPASGSPVTPTVPAGSIGLWSVKITAGTSAGSGGWNTANLVDLRPSLQLGPLVKPIGHMGRNAGFQVLSGITTVGMDVANVLRGGMTFSSTNKTLTVPAAGYYRVTAQAYFSGTTAGVDIAYIAKNGNVTGINGRANPTASDTAFTISGILQLAAGDAISLQAQSGGQQAFGSSGYDGCFVEVEYIGPVQ
jgi:hypothetical protein